MTSSHTFKQPKNNILFPLVRIFFAGFSNKVATKRASWKLADHFPPRSFYKELLGGSTVGAASRVMQGKIAFSAHRPTRSSSPHGKSEGRWYGARVLDVWDSRERQLSHLSLKLSRLAARSLMWRARDQPSLQLVIANQPHSKLAIIHELTSQLSDFSWKIMSYAEWQRGKHRLRLYNLYKQSFSINSILFWKKKIGKLNF
jgi:hypothetical protein